jgi:hypothetical protein
MQRKATTYMQDQDCNPRKPNEHLGLAADSRLERVYKEQLQDKCNACQVDMPCLRAIER